ncbi:MAG: DUF4926 domain-containing protein [Akkermansiaceae bacterium]|nr:DUF4926 domain-containing protein [Armatimonadota bacterium]
MIAERTDSKIIFKLYDVARLAKDVPGTSLRAGQTGTIVDRLAGGAFEVEFVDPFGCTIESRGFYATELLPAETK